MHSTAAQPLHYHAQSPPRVSLPKKQHRRGGAEGQGCIARDSVLTQTLIVGPRIALLAPFMKVVFLAQDRLPPVTMRMARPCVMSE